MLNFLPRRTAAGFLTGLLLWSAAAEAIVFNLANRATPRITILVGGSGGNISEVEFNVPATRIGNGTAITGSPAIRIQLDVRASGASPLTATLSADSLGSPLTHSDGGGAVVPPAAFVNVGAANVVGELLSVSISE